jgi:hypothetical protein
VIAAMLIVAAIVIPLVAGSDTRAPSGGAAARERQIAQGMNLVSGDLPATWTVDRSSNGPLASFLGSGTSGGGSSSSQDHQLQVQVAAQFEQCMGITAPADRIFGSAGATPSAQASSPAFAAPAGAPVQEAGSSVALFSSASSVAADVAQVESPKFPSCFGAALATSFVQAGQQSSGGAAQFGEPQVQPVLVPVHQGVVTAGADVTISVTAHGVTVPLQFGVIFVGGGRAEATLCTYSSPQPFPPELSTSLTRALAASVQTGSPGTPS